MKRVIKIISQILLVLGVFLLAIYVRDGYFNSNYNNTNNGRLVKESFQAFLTTKYHIRTNTMRQNEAKKIIDEDLSNDHLLLDQSGSSGDQKYKIPVAFNEESSNIKLKNITSKPFLKENIYEATKKYREKVDIKGSEVYGRLDTNRSYAVFGTTTDSRDSTSYIFYLPLTVLAWKRVGFGSLIIIVGSRLIWTNDPLLSFVLEQLIRLEAVLIFIESESRASVMLSQVSRIYAGNIIYSRDNSVGNVYLLTADADIWPLQSREYLLPDKKCILSLNADCCAPFKHREKVYRMLPMSNIGMRIKDWKNVTNHYSVSPSSTDEIMTQIVRELGSIALKPTHKGDNVGWFLDQILISIFIAKWNAINPTGVKYTSRDVSLDRVDRNSWKVSSIDDKIDAHLPIDGYKPEVWKKITPLLELMYDRHGKEASYYKFYYKKFILIIEKNGIP